jgi:hypothetical protein
MPDDQTRGPGAGRRPVPDVVGASTRVNVAFPFSNIKVQEPSKDVAELAAVVEALAEVVGELAPGPGADDLLRRAREVAARLR